MRALSNDGRIYSDDHLKKIAASLAPLGVVADLTPGGHLQKRLEATAQLFRFARDHGSTDPMTMLGTPKQKAEELETTLAAISAARATLKKCATEYPYDDVAEDPDIFDFLSNRHLLVDSYAGEIHSLGVADEILARWADSLQRQRAALPTVGDGRSRNAGKLHVKFWLELEDLWTQLTAHAGRRRQHKHLQAFLAACTAPVFEITPAALEAFTRRHFNKRTSKIRGASR